MTGISKEVSDCDNRPEWSCWNRNSPQLGPVVRQNVSCTCVVVTHVHCPLSQTICPPCIALHCRRRGQGWWEKGVCGLQLVRFSPMEIGHIALSLLLSLFFSGKCFHLFHSMLARDDPYTGPWRLLLPWVDHAGCLADIFPGDLSRARAPSGCPPSQTAATNTSARPHHLRETSWSHCC
jgi:hypothetical protein